MSDQIVYWQNDRNPSLTDQLTSNGVAVDLSAATVTFKMRGPLDGGNTNATVKVNRAVDQKDAQGNWRVDWQAGELDIVGRFLVWLEVTTGGKTQTLWESILEVRPHDGVHLYIELEEAKATFDLTGLTFADIDVQRAVNSASRAIDDACSPPGTLTRRFWKDADATGIRYYSPAGDSLGYNADALFNHGAGSPGPEWLRIHDLVTLAELATDPGGDGTFEQVWTVNTDFVLEPMNAAADGWPYDAIRVHPAGRYYLPSMYPRTVRVTGKFGWPAVPEPVKTATSILIARLTKRMREAPLGVLPGGLDVVATRIAKTDPDIGALIARYQRRGSVVR